MKVENQILLLCVQKLADACAENKSYLCDADSLLGDGDLGLTMSTGWAAIANDSDKWPDDCSKFFFEISKSLQRASASSFGTLQATGFMAAAKYCKENKIEVLDTSQIAPLLDVAWKAMAKRGKGELGQKSVLDVIYALSQDLSHENIDNYKLAAQASINNVLDNYRDKKNGLGRARMFAEKSIGVDDPGMLAIKVLTDAL
jgi:dihydroxyacetone kinase-like protein